MKPVYIITRTVLYDDHWFCLEEIFLDTDTCPEYNRTWACELNGEWTVTNGLIKLSKPIL